MSSPKTPLYPMQAPSFTKDSLAEPNYMTMVFQQTFKELNRLRGANGSVEIPTGMDMKGARVANVGPPVSPGDAISSAHAETKYSAPAQRDQLDIGKPYALKGLTTAFIQIGKLKQTVGTGVVNSLNTLNGALSITAGPGITVAAGGSTITVSATIVAAVTALNSLTGNVTLAAGTGISITPSGNTLTIANTGTTGPAGGDLSGTYPNPTVAKIQTIPVQLATPTANQVLQYNSGTAEWEPTTLTAPALTTLPYVEKTAAYTITGTDYQVNCTSGTFTVTLPTAIGIQGQMFSIKNSGNGTITLAPTAGQTIDGETIQTIPAGSNLVVMSTNAGWIIV